ncbi:MAG: hypothetical protein RLZZ558_413 [Planctomycetota bacterium]|jgi:hypothetical protein
MSASARLANRVRGRLQAQRRLDALATAIVVAGVTACVTLAVTRLAGAHGMSLSLLLGAAAGGAASVLVLGRSRGPTITSAAIQLDERLGLDGRIANALALHGRRDGMAVAAIEDGDRLAGNRDTQAGVARAFPWRVPPLAVWTLVVWPVWALGAWWLPVRTVPVAETPAVAQTSLEESAARAEATDQGLQRAAETIAESPEAAERLQDLLVEMERRQASSRLESDPARREAEAMERAAAMESRLADELESIETSEARQLREMLAGLPELPDQARALSQALKSGDLDKAMQEVERLSQQTASGDAEQARAATEALQRVAEALQTAAASRAAFHEALREAGIDPAKAESMAEARQAIERSPSLTPEQKQQLQKKVESAERASEQCRNMGQGMSQASRGSSSAAKQSMSRAASQQRMERVLRKAMGQCKGGSEMGWSMPWERRAAGPGSGRGKGAGGSPRTDGRTEALADGALPDTEESAGDGDLRDEAVARQFVRGEGVRGELSQAQLQVVVTRVQQGLEEGTEEDPVPSHLKEAHKRYFEQWKRRLDAKPAAGP